jgi:hypothetical protein
MPHGSGTGSALNRSNALKCKKNAQEEPSGLISSAAQPTT